MTRTAQDVAREAGLHGIYPATWDDFVGQEDAKRRLKLAAESARNRDATCAHILLASGVPGIGKTSLALNVAAALGTSVKIVSGKITMNQARVILSDMKDKDVLFWDEIHMAVAGGKSNAEWLLPFLQDGVLVSARATEEAPKITVVGATTDKGRLEETLLERFKIKPDLYPYTDEEAVRIAAGMARALWGKVLDPPNPEDFPAVARAAHNTPRQISAVLEAMRDLVAVEGNYTIEEALQLTGLTADGLTLLARRYLLALKDFVEPIGRVTLAEHLQEKGNLVPTQRLLIELGYITLTKRGVELTGPGLRRAREIEKENDDA